MEIEGKTVYTIEEAAEITGYTPGTISNYVYSGIIEGQKLGDGQWVVTKTGLVQLQRRKKDPPPNPPVKENPDRIADANKTIDTASSDDSFKFKEGKVYIKIPIDNAIYEDLKTAAGRIGCQLGDLAMTAVRYYVTNVLPGKFEELDKLEAQKQAILMEML